MAWMAHGIDLLPCNTSFLTNNSTKTGTFISSTHSDTHLTITSFCLAVLDYIFSMECTAFSYQYWNCY